MNIKKMFVVFFLMMIIGITPVFADCTDCKPGDCDTCGCVENSSKTACIYPNFDKVTPLKCGIDDSGEALLDGIPPLIPQVVSIAYNIIQIAVPILLVIMGSIDLMKGITAQKDDEIKKGQQMFIKRLISAALIFFVFIIVKLVVGFVADSDSNDNRAERILQCTKCFISNDCKKQG